MENRETSVNFNVLWKNILKIRTQNFFKIINISPLFRGYVNVKQNFNFQIKAQIAQKHDKTKLKNT